MVIFTGSAMGIVWFLFEGFFWKEILKPKNHKHKTALFTFQEVDYCSIFYQSPNFGAMVRYRLSSDLISNFNLNFSHDEFKN